MDKLAVFKSRRQNLRDLVRYSNSTGMHKFEDRYLKKEEKDVQFAHSWANLAHMHDLRVWTLAYAPGKGNLQRMQEIHRLNAEMWY